ncbi:MAG: pantoate--beta-alanine ligase [Planctomycetota bacterium]
MPTSVTPPMPEVITRAADFRAHIETRRTARQTVGLVPTMGALHAGHASLVEAARGDCDVVAATLFVNPKQFGPGEDFDRYPRGLDADRRLLADAGCDLVFCPSVDEMYPAGSATSIDVGAAGRVLEGAFRPTHFAGVATVVLKLFNLAPADRAYFGRKDYQQTVVVRRMVADLNVPIEVVVCPTVRDADGLAMSSRNAYLSPAERVRALALSRGLRLAEQMHAGGERRASAFRESIEQLLTDAGAAVQYVAVLEPGTVDEIAEVEGKAVIAVAAMVGQTRLIDNATIG